MKELELWHDANPGMREGDIGSRHFADKLQIGNMVLHGWLAAVELLQGAAEGRPAGELPLLPPVMEAAFIEEEVEEAAGDDMQGIEG